ncbi:MAG TPA: phosphoribosyltransferase family protein, partial [Abditibacteriaceae bacterium]
ALAAPLAGLMNEYLQSQGAQSHIPLERIELVVPVPLHAWRRYRRGYNQSELLAHELVLLMKRENSTVLCANILRRVRHTTSQVELNERDRVENVRGAFEATGAPASFHKNGAVLLIDDVCTTGATLRECARALEAAGVREIYALALARQL